MEAHVVEVNNDDTNFACLCHEGVLQDLPDSFGNFGKVPDSFGEVGGSDSFSEAGGFTAAVASLDVQDYL
jgi:hypothetical protein